MNLLNEFNFSIYLKNFLSPTRSVIKQKDYYFFKEKLKNCKYILNVGSSSETILGSKFLKILSKNSKITNLDIKESKKVDIVADAMNMPIKNDSYDLVICQATLEHISFPVKAISEIHRVLKNNGYLYCTIPFLQGFHADPYDFQRFTLNGGEILLKDFNIIKKGVSSGPFSSIAWIIRDLLSFGPKRSFLYNLTRGITSILIFPISSIDYFIQEIIRIIGTHLNIFILSKKDKWLILAPQF